MQNSSLKPALIGLSISLVFYLTSIYTHHNQLYHLAFFITIAITIYLLLKLLKLQALFSDISLSLNSMTEGHGDKRLYLPVESECEDLVANFNKLLEQLISQSDNYKENIKQLESVLDSMQEGVIALDARRRIIRINRAGASILATASGSINRSIHEVARQSEFLDFVDSCQSIENSLAQDIELHYPQAKILRIKGSSLKDSEWHTIGTLLVFADITHIKHLEKMRSEFVANVSHELRTPITAISGAVETLQTGGFEDLENANRFLQIISQQALRLTNIFDDLLALSRIEEERSSGKICFALTDISDAATAAIESITPLANKKKVSIKFNQITKVQAEINKSLLEQAIINLLSNAITYSSEGSTVCLTVANKDDTVIITVQDSGIGIEPIHIPRIFERFYRVDKSRSRKAGGTGLGLAIVKHIVESHNGKIHVESKIGVGTTFVITIPLTINK